MIDAVDLRLMRFTVAVGVAGTMDCPISTNRYFQISFYEIGILKKSDMRNNWQFCGKKAIESIYYCPHFQKSHS